MTLRAASGSQKEGDLEGQQGRLSVILGAFIQFCHCFLSRRGSAEAQVVPSSPAKDPSEPPCCSSDAREVV